MINGRNRDAQRAQFGDTATRQGRPLVVQTIKDYAQASGNYHLLSVLRRFEDFRPNMPTAPARQQAKVMKPILPERERDYGSIVSVLDRLGRPVGTADLGRFRRRWLEYPPRDPSSGHRNRLEEVLAAMVRDGVLRALPTAKGAVIYGPGPNYEAHAGSVVRGE
jgi:hypothetical protein